MKWVFFVASFYFFHSIIEAQDPRFQLATEELKKERVLTSLIQKAEQDPQNVISRRDFIVGCYELLSHIKEEMNKVRQILRRMEGEINEIRRTTPTPRGSSREELLNIEQRLKNIEKGFAKTIKENIDQCIKKIDKKTNDLIAEMEIKKSENVREARIIGAASIITTIIIAILMTK